MANTTRRRRLRDRIRDRLQAILLVNDPLRRRIAMTVWLLVCVRAVGFVPLPGFGSAAQPPRLGGVVDLLLPGSADLARRVGVATMGVSPYIASSIFIGVSLALNPSLRAWRKDAGAAGSDVVAQWGRRLGLAASLAQAMYTALLLRPSACPALLALPLHAYVAVVAAPLAAGTSTVVWLAEEVTRTGLGQGLSAVISLSIVGAWADALRDAAPSLASGAVPGWVLALCGAAILVHTALSVLVVEGVARVPIAFFQLQAGAAGRATGGAALAGDHIPFRANPAGIQPVLFAVALLDGVPWAMRAFDGGAHALAAVEAVLHPGSVVYSLLYFVIVFAFTFVDVEDTPKEVAEYVLKVGARVVGVRPGAATVAHLRGVQTSARFWGGLLLATIAVISSVADAALQAAAGRSIGFTSMLLVTGTFLQMRRQALALAQKPLLAKTLARL